MKFLAKINRSSKKIWTEEEKELLLENWLNYNQNELHEKFLPNKSPIQINRKKMQIGLKKPPVWSDKEIEILFENSEKYTNTELSKSLLPNKTPRQITDRRKYYGLKSLYSGKKIGSWLKRN